MNDPAICLHRGARQHTANLIEGAGKPVFHEMHERLDGRETEVSRPWAVGALGLEVFQKGRHQWGIELLELEIGGLDSQTRAGKGEQELERVGVSIAGVPACAAFQGKAFTEISSDVWRNGTHGDFSSSWLRHALAIPTMRCGVAWMYQ
jgi:hypothetical protein